MTQSTYKTERTNVQSTLWRKKVDNTFFRYKVTPIPKWVLDGWQLEKFFPGKNGFLRKTDKESEVEIEFNPGLRRAPGGQGLRAARGCFNSLHYRLYWHPSFYVQLIYRLPGCRRQHYDNVQRT